MFMGPLEMVKPWSTKGVEGVYRFLGRIWRIFISEESITHMEQNLTLDITQADHLLEELNLSPDVQDVEPTPEQLKAIHRTIKKVTEDLDGLRFNTAISALMVFINEAISWEVKPASILLFRSPAYFRRTCVQAFENNERFPCLWDHSLFPMAAI
jgi:leucyl-tRNA synthetase